MSWALAYVDLSSVKMRVKVGWAITGLGDEYPLA